MVSFTTKMGLALPAGGDQWDRTAHMNFNTQRIDDLFGLVECTSGTRPSTPYAGQLIFETDTGYLLRRKGDNLAWRVINQILGVTNNSDVAAPFTNQVIWNKTDFCFYYWNGSSWQRVTPAPIAPPTQLNSGTVAAAGTIILFQQTVNYPGYPFWIEVAASAGWGVVAASTPGILIEGNINYDSTTYSTNRISVGYQISASLGAGFTQPSLVLPPKNTGNISAFTSNKTIRFIVRNVGASSVTFGAAAVDSYMNVRLIPAN